MIEGGIASELHRQGQGGKRIDSHIVRLSQDGSSVTKSPRILLVETNNWPSAPRLAIALHQAGFVVDAVFPVGHLLAKTKVLARSFAYHISASRTIAEAIKISGPALIIPCDDGAALSLHRMHDRALISKTRSDRSTAQKIAESLGNPANFALYERRSALVLFAAEQGIPVPETHVVENADDLRSRLSSAAFPVVLKVDGTSGGRGVRILRGVEDATRIYYQLLRSPSWSQAFKRSAKGLHPRPLVARFGRVKPTITLQRYVAGRPANRAVACWRGEILAGLSVEALSIYKDTGPATVVRPIKHQQMEQTSRELVRKLGISGLCGFDFMIDEATQRALLIEMNARATQPCHLALGAAEDLLGALFSKLTGQRRRSLSPFPRAEGIVMFPQAWVDDPQSEFIRSGYHDVPWEEPDLVRACINLSTKAYWPLPAALVTHIARLLKHPFGQRQGRISAAANSSPVRVPMPLVPPAGAQYPNERSLQD
jgi:hypothetical protein